MPMRSAPPSPGGAPQAPKRAAALLGRAPASPDSPSSPASRVSPVSRVALFVSFGLLVSLVVACIPASAPPRARATGEGSSDAAAPATPATPATKATLPGSDAGPVPELRVGTSGDYAPFSFRAPSGELRGFDVDLATAMAEDLGIRVRWVPFRWPTLARELADGEFEVAMGGVTWQPTRAVVGYMTRAVARGGPCVLGDPAASRVAVNRGGVLETWARAHLAGREIVAVDDNRSLPDLLAGSKVGAIVTDSFEQRAFRRPTWALTCEPPVAQKVYWVAPEHRELGARIDGWLAGHRERVRATQERWFGEPQRLDAIDELVDLLARRMAFMPLVGGLKATLGVPVEDLARERVVLDQATGAARARGLPEAPVRALFALQIELSKAVERRMHEPTSLDLTRQIRPALSELGARIVDALAAAHAARRLASATLADLEPLSPWLDASERGRLLERLRAIDAGTDAGTAPAPEAP